MSYTESDYLDAVAYLEKRAKRDREHFERTGVERYVSEQERKIIADTIAKIQEVDPYFRPPPNLQ